MKKLLCFISFCALLCSCGSETATNDGRVIKLYENINTETINEDFTLNEIFDDLQLVQLEENEKYGSKYPYLWSVSEIGDLCFVDFANNQVISVYDKEGKLISALSKMGKGEGEFLYVSSVSYNDDLTTIYGSVEKKIHIFNKDGESVYSSDFPNVIEIKELPNDRYLCRASTPYNEEIGHNLVVLDKNGKVVEKFLPIDTTSNSTQYFNSPISKVNGKYEFAVQTFKDNKQYSFDIITNQLTDVCTFDLGDYAPKSMEDFIALSSSEGEFDAKFIFSLRPMKIGDYMFINYMYRSKRYYEFWDLKEAKIIARRTCSIYEQKGVYKYITKNGEAIVFDFNSFLNHNDKFITSQLPTTFEALEGYDFDADGNIVIATLSLKK